MDTSKPSAASHDPTPRGSSVVSLEALEVDVKRGAPLRVRGEVRSLGQACERVTVEIDLRDPRHVSHVSLGALATDASGKFAGSLVLPRAVRTGDYDVFAHTAGGPSCAAGESR